jgi:hypothetical protein
MPNQVRTANGVYGEVNPRLEEKAFRGQAVANQTLVTHMLGPALRLEAIALSSGLVQAQIRNVSAGQVRWAWHVLRGYQSVAAAAGGTTVALAAGAVANLLNTWGHPNTANDSIYTFDAVVIDHTNGLMGRWDLNGTVRLGSGAALENLLISSQFRMLPQS